KSEVDKYIEVPLIHAWMTPALYLTIQYGCETALADSLQIKKPGLVYHGTCDEIIDWETSKQFADKNDLIEWKAIEGAYHEPHNDLVKNEIFELISGWIKKY
ncbi:unnamed protein product, partial [Chrysoparadoxa australica]